ncbi:histidinol-phosphate transaminase [Shewanella sp. 202IG2-18]|uniref:histidinol-phosphate transaminase n=1 Tax=Parashewanella hymeniacidonis TaxID=2807618 RepID=UPI001961EB3A|nr:histidinol-phosphate transaminase [Parashewanella hymeniacidonis]MBM7072712.1 histidinol-phosphate transaminase [Parashewanella hymeniacidonis]
MAKENSIVSLLREDLSDLKPYQSARRIGGKGKIFINANESPFANVDLGAVNFDTINRYPEQQPERLVEAYANYANVEPQNVVCTRGADEAIELLIRTFCNVGKDSISYFAPSYGMYQISAKTCGIRSIQVPFNDDYTLPSDWSNTEKSKLTFICNPNNPTGTIITPSDIKAVLNRTPFGLVVVDEAYIDFSIENTVTDLVKEYPNLVVLRTLSKAFALAGLRCGFLISSPQVTQQVLKVLAPYPVSVPVEQIATQALSSTGITLMKQQRQLIEQNRQLLMDALIGIAQKVLPSASNFVYAEFDDADAIWSELVDQEIIARRYVVEKLKNGIRFTIGSTAENYTLINLFNNIKQLKDEQ